MRLSSADGCVTGRFARQRRTGVRTAGLGSNSSDQGFLSGRVKVACRRPVLCNVLRRYRRCETILGSAQDPLTHGVFRQPLRHFPTRRVRAHSRRIRPRWARRRWGPPPRVPTPGCVRSAATRTPAGPAATPEGRHAPADPRTPGRHARLLGRWLLGANGRADSQRSAER